MLSAAAPVAVSRVAAAVSPMTVLVVLTLANRICNEHLEEIELRVELEPEASLVRARIVGESTESW